MRAGPGVYTGFIDNGDGTYSEQSDTLPPTQVYRTDLSGGYTETLTMSAAPDLDMTTGAPLGTEAIADVQNLTRSIMNSAGQVIETDAYYNLTTNESTSEAWAYSTTAQIGTAWNPASPATAANYDKTTYQYDALGDLDRTVDADGNITRDVYDGLERETSVWVGTDDTPSTGYWSPTNNDGSSNMVEISADVYDNGGMGDSLLTETIEFPGGNSVADAGTFEVDRMVYNWQDELVETKQSAMVEEVLDADVPGDSTNFKMDGIASGYSVVLTPLHEGTDGDTTANRPLTYDVLDNEGEVVAEATYDGDDLGLTATDGVPDVHSGSLLRSLVFYAYDAQGREYSTTEYSVDQTSGISGYSLSATPPSDLANLVESTVYDAAGKVTETDVYDVNLAGDAINTQTADYGYDGADREISVSQPDPESGDGSTTPGYLTTTTTYDGDGNVLTETDPMGNVTTFVYDTAGRETAVYQPNPDGGSGPSCFVGLSTTNPETIYTYDTAGNVCSVEGPTGVVTTYCYDALGEQTSATQTDPETGDGSATAGYLITHTTYDGDGNVLSVTDPMGQVTSYEYDTFGDQVAVILPSVTVTGTDGTGSTSTCPETTSTYDNLGELLSTTDANGDTTTYEYNTLGQQVLETDPAPGTDDPTIGTPTLEAGATVATTYDTLGGVLSQSNTIGQTTEYTYDGFHNLASETNPGVADDTTSFSYDALGNMLSETDADGNTTNFTYDTLNRTTSQYETVALSYNDETHVETDGTATTSYVYDADSDLTETINPDGNAIVDTYDNLNREIQENWYASSGDLADPTETINYSYNLAGQVTDAYDNEAGYSYSYDTVGRLDVIDNLGGETDGTPGVADVQLDIAYNADGSQTSVAATIGGTADFLDTYSYNAAQWLTSITQQGQEGGATVGGENVTFNHDASGETTGEAMYQSTDTSDLVAQETTAYDDAGRVESMTYANADGSTVYDSFSYTYDSGNQLYSYADAQYSAEDATYSYDAAGELTAAAPTNGGESPNAANTYSDSYDPNGNAATIDDGTTVTGKGNRLLSDGTWDYTLDLSGNIVSQTGVAGGAAAGQTIDYDHNVKNELTGVAYYTDDVQTLAIGYTYDMYGQLLSRTLTNYTDGIAGTPSTANYVYGPTGDMSLAFVNGSLTDRYLSGPAVDQILADEQLSTGNTWWTATDDQGTVKDVLEFDCGTDTTSVASHLAYSPFGNLDTADSTLGGVATVDFLFGYTGTWTDPATGLQWHDNRWYNPAIQQWMSEDPDGLSAGPNPYAYAGNAPANATDPSGLDAANGPWSYGETCWAGNTGNGFRLDVEQHDLANGRVVIIYRVTHYSVDVFGFETDRLVQAKVLVVCKGQVAATRGKWDKLMQAIAQGDAAVEEANGHVADLEGALRVTIITGATVIGVGLAGDALAWLAGGGEEIAAAADAAAADAAADTAASGGTDVIGAGADATAGVAGGTSADVAGDAGANAAAAGGDLGGAGTASESDLSSLQDAIARVGQSDEAFPGQGGEPSTAPEAHADIGGEGRYPNAVNVNPNTVTSTTGSPGRPIPNLVQGVGENLPFPTASVPGVSVENAPITAETASEIARVIEPGGSIRLVSPADYAEVAHQRVIDAVGGTYTQTTTGGITTTVITAPK